MTMSWSNACRSAEPSTPCRPRGEEGDTIILPVVEEVLVVERRLILKEEVRLRRVRTTRRHTETVTVREQVAVVTRSACGTAAGGITAPPASSTSNQHTKEQPMIDKTPSLPPAQDTFVAPLHDRSETETLVAVFENPTSRPGRHPRPA